MKKRTLLVQPRRSKSLVSKEHENHNLGLRHHDVFL